VRRLGVRRRKELVERAQKLLPELPTGSLYRLTAILERILAEPDIEDEAYLELEAALPRTRKPGSR
jgi:hypothetical protein